MEPAEVSALARTIWRVVADFTPLQYVTPGAFWVLLLVGPAALIVAKGLAAWPRSPSGSDAHLAHLEDGVT